MRRVSAPRRESYDSLGRVNQVRDAINLQVGDHTVAGGRDPWTFYIADGTRGERDDPLGNPYSVTYDVFGHPWRFIDALGRETDAVADGLGRVQSYTYPEGDQEQFAYDARSNPLSLTKIAKPGSGLASIAVSVAYNEGPTVAACANIITCDKPATQTDAKGNVSNLTWDSVSGLLTQTLLPAPVSGGTRPETDYAYASFGTDGFKLLTTTTQKIDATHSLVTSFGYNASNDYVPQSATVDPTGLDLVTSFTFDAQGDVTHIDGPRTDVSDVSDFTTDLDRREVFGILADPDGAGPHTRPASKITYDAEGHVIETDTGTTTSATGSDFSAVLAVLDTIDPVGNRIKETTPTRATQFSFDGANRPLCTAVRMNPAVFGSLPADACTLGTAGSFGPDRITKTIYDAAGQTLQELRAVGTPLQITYATNTWSLNGKLASVTDADGAAHLTTYTYDGFDRPTVTHFADATTDQVTSYDANSNPLTRLNRSGQSFTLTYDNLSRLTVKVVPTAGTIPANTVTTGYDLLNKVLTASDTNGNTIAEVYDLAGRKTSETRTTPTLAAKTVSYQYDAASNRTRLTWPDGYYANYSYDALNHPTTVIDSGSTTLATYGYDALARRASLQYNGTAGAKMLYSWSAENDLLTLQSDLAGTANDVSFTNTFTPAHQWASNTVSNPTFEYAPPNTSTVAYAAANNLNQYPTVAGTAMAYDTRGNLTTDGTTATTYVYDAENRLMSATRSAATSTYAYDPNGRRTKKTVSGTTTNFIHDGDSEIAEYDGSGNLLRRYVPGPVIDEYVAMVTAAGVKTFFHTDKMGSVIAMSDTSGNMVEGPYVYDSYGNCTAGGLVCSAGVPFRYTGQRLDPETGDYYYRARYYGPGIGRFLQTDPVGHKDDLNLYTYGGNDPTDLIDPMGLTRITPNGGLTTDCGTVESCNSYGGAPFISKGVKMGSISLPEVTVVSVMSHATDSAIADKYTSALDSAEAKARAAKLIKPGYVIRPERKYALAKPVYGTPGRMTYNNERDYDTYSEFAYAYSTLYKQGYGVLNGYTPLGSSTSTIYLNGAMDFGKMTNIGGFGVFAPSERAAAHTMFHEYDHGAGSEPTEPGADAFADRMVKLLYGH